MADLPKGYRKHVTARLQKVVDRLRLGPLTGTNAKEVGMKDNNNLKVAMSHLRALGFVITSDETGARGGTRGRRPGVYHLVSEPDPYPTNPKLGLKD